MRFNFIKTFCSFYQKAELSGGRLLSGIEHPASYLDVHMKVWNVFRKNIFIVHFQCSKYKTTDYGRVPLVI